MYSVYLLKVSHIIWKQHVAKTWRLLQQAEMIRVNCLCNSTLFRSARQQLLPVSNGIIRDITTIKKYHRQKIQCQESDVLERFPSRLAQINCQRDETHKSKNGFGILDRNFVRQIFNLKRAQSRRLGKRRIRFVPCGNKRWHVPHAAWVNCKSCNIQPNDKEHRPARDGPTGFWEWSFAKRLQPQGCQDGQSDHCNGCHARVKNGQQRSRADKKVDQNQTDSSSSGASLCDLHFSSFPSP